MTYESWRLTYQDPEQAARAAYKRYEQAYMALYVSMLKMFPEKSHAELQAELERVMGRMEK